MSVWSNGPSNEYYIESPPQLHTDEQIILKRALQYQTRSSMYKESHTVRHAHIYSYCIYAIPWAEKHSNEHVILRYLIGRQTILPSIPLCTGVVPDRVSIVDADGEPLSL